MFGSGPRALPLVARLGVCAMVGRQGEGVGEADLNLRGREDGICRRSWLPLLRPWSEEGVPRSLEADRERPPAVKLKG